MTIKDARSEAGLVLYSCGNFGKNLVFFAADVTMAYILTDLAGLGGAVTGLVMLAAVLGDMVFDLLAARLMIGLRASGRGYRWLIVAGAVPGGLAFALLFTLPWLGLTRGWLLGATLLAFRAAYAVVDVPHNAMMARISGNSRARGRISGYRLFFSTAASLAVATLVVPLVQQAHGAEGLLALARGGWIAGALFAMTLAFCVGGSGGQHADEQRLPVGGNRSDGLAIPLRAPLVLGLAAIGVITGFAMPMFTRTMLYLTTYVLARPDLAQTILLAATLGQFAGVLVWTSLAGRFDKSRLLALGHGATLLALALFAVSLGHPDRLPWCAALVGMGMTCVFMLPWGLLADSVDFLAWQHGRRFETGLFAAFLVVIKASGAAGSALIGLTLDAMGYVPGQAQGALVQGAILVLALGVPTLGALAAMAVLARFAIGHARHARLVAAWQRLCAQGRSWAGAEPVAGS